jgi:hypothetical protein
VAAFSRGRLTATAAPPWAEEGNENDDRRSQAGGLRRWPRRGRAPPRRPRPRLTLEQGVRRLGFLGPSSASQAGSEPRGDSRRFPALGRELGTTSGRERAGHLSTNQRRPATLERVGAPYPCVTRWQRPSLERGQSTQKERTILLGRQDRPLLSEQYPPQRVAGRRSFAPDCGQQNACPTAYEIVRLRATGSGQTVLVFDRAAEQHHEESSRPCGGGHRRDP